MNGITVTTSKVVAVLLADGWHRVVSGSFSVGPLGFAAEADPNVLGFSFEEPDTASPYRPAALAGPVNSIIAVRQVTPAVRHVSTIDRRGAGHGAEWSPEAAPRQPQLLAR
jgi:hypothetical protein